MNESIIHEVAHRISQNYGIPPPKLLWDIRSDARYRGTALPWRNTIRFTPGHFLVDTAIHEMAHIVVYNYVFKHPCQPRSMHGPHFFRELIICARVWYGDPRLYNWKDEYTSIHKRAIKVGLSPAPSELATPPSCPPASAPQPPSDILSLFRFPQGAPTP